VNGCAVFLTCLNYMQYKTSFYASPRLHLGRRRRTWLSSL